MFHAWKNHYYVSNFIKVIQMLWEMMVFSSYALFPFSLQEDNKPVGGFSLRGCLVSALEDNGVPAGELWTSTHLYVCCSNSLWVWVCIYGFLYAQVGWLSISLCKQGKRHEACHKSLYCWVVHSKGDYFFFLSFPHILGVLFIWAFLSHMTCETVLRLINIPELTDKEKPLSFWVLTRSLEASSDAIHFCVLSTYAITFSFLTC